MEMNNKLLNLYDGVSSTTIVIVKRKKNKGKVHAHEGRGRGSRPSDILYGFVKMALAPEPCVRIVYSILPDTALRTTLFCTLTTTQLWLKTIFCIRHWSLESSSTHPLLGQFAALCTEYLSGALCGNSSY